MNHLKVLLSLTLALLICCMMPSCTKDALTASFSINNGVAEPIEIYPGEVVYFGDASSDYPTSWAWTFNGGRPTSSTNQHPNVLYKNPGTYDVVLTATNAEGSNTFTCAGCIIVKNAGAQELLNSGKSMQSILRAKPLDSLYGKNYQGGLIYYIDSINGSGLIAAMTDQSASAQWGCAGTYISGASGTAVGNGIYNTSNIISDCQTIGIAADLCSNLNEAGYTDWYLPTYYELFYMYQNLKMKGIGNFSNANYWTSSQSVSNPNFEAVRVNFSDGTNAGMAKNLNARVRAYRSFQ